MIAYLKGKILHKDENSVIVLNENIGYQVMVNSIIWHNLKEKQEAELFIYHHVREDAQILYGFTTLLERKIFLLITSVSGIGPKTGLAFLNKYTPEQLVKYIAKADLSAISSISGVGKKTAEKVIIELKDKVIKQFPEVKLEAGDKKTYQIIPGVLEEGFRSELGMALTSLGYNSKEIEKAIERNTALLAEVSDVEAGLKIILKNFH